MLPKQNRIFMAVIALLVLILALGYFIFNGDEELLGELSNNPIKQLEKRP